MRFLFRTISYLMAKFLASNNTHYFELLVAQMYMLLKSHQDHQVLLEFIEIYSPTNLVENLLFFTAAATSLFFKGSVGKKFLLENNSSRFSLDPG